MSVRELWETKTDSSSHAGALEHCHPIVFFWHLPAHVGWLITFSQEGEKDGSELSVVCHRPGWDPTPATGSRPKRGLLPVMCLWTNCTHVKLLMMSVPAALRFPPMLWTPQQWYFHKKNKAVHSVLKGWSLLVVQLWEPGGLMGCHEFGSTCEQSVSVPLS